MLRDGNRVADAVASFFREHGGCLEWDYIDSKFMFNILAADVYRPFDYNLIKSTLWQIFFFFVSHINKSKNSEKQNKRLTY